LALLPQETPKQIALLVAILTLGGMYAFYTYWYEPRALEIEEMETRLSQLETMNRQAQVVSARSGPDLAERLAVYERHVDRLEELIPAREEVATLMNSLTLEAQRAGVDLTGLTPEAPLPGELYTLQSYGVSVVGDFHDVGRFLAAVASLPRIVTPVDLVIEPFGGPAVRLEMTAPVSARFRVQTYVLPDPGVSAETPPPGN
jgi:type IV pilus assembly protein PilO